MKSGSIPLPGVTVSAANTLTGKKFITSTDLDGGFKLAVSSKGRYVVRAEFSGFAVVTQELVINDDNRTGKADLSMILLSRAQREEQQRAAQAASAGQQGVQRLSLTGGDLGGVTPASSAGGDPSAMGLPNAGLAADGNNESVAVSGAMGRNDQPTFDPGEMQDRIAELRDQLMRQGGGSGSISLNGGTANINIVGGGGGFGGGGGGGPMIFMIGGPGGGGGRRGRGFNVNRMHGSIFYTYGGSGLDARPYSLSGQEESKPSYNQNRFGVSIG
ncbi:MAG TPA: carboxypeptidase-like regulatory domain-containing protein, partial [Alphaproteobacteria bacterium]|nr:carboxypeptidase-like regulatory domain-containing protein [Alphaproteobacteria bacterium]